MKTLILFIFMLSAINLFALNDTTGYNKWSIEPEIGVTKVRDMPYHGSTYEPLNISIGGRYMVTEIFGVRLLYSYTQHKYTLTGEPLKYSEGQFFGVCNFGRLAKLEQVLNNRWTILGGVGGDFSDSHGFTNTQIFEHQSNFHLAAFVDNEFRVTDRFFLAFGLNVTAGVNVTPDPNSTPTTVDLVAATNIVRMNLKAIFAIGKKRPHADFYLEPQPLPIINTYYIDSSKCITNVANTNIYNKYDTCKIENNSPEYVFFSNDMFKIDKDGLENIEQSLHKVKDKVTITGYCSNVGAVEYNKTLAKLRAEAVKNKLVNLGIDSNKITIVVIGIDKSREYDMARRVSIEFK